MDIKTYLADLDREQKDEFAKKVKTSAAYLSQIASGHRKAGLELALRIQCATDRRVTVYDLAGVSANCINE